MMFMLPERDQRALRLFDLAGYESVEIRCEWGWVTNFMHGLLQRKYRIPPDTLVYASGQWI